MRSKWYLPFVFVIIASMVLTACAQTPAATSAAPQVIQQTVIVAGTPQVQVVTATPAPAQAQTFASKDPTTFTVQEFGEPETLDPALDYETGGNEIIFNTHDTLVYYDKNVVDKLVPWLATEVPSTENGGISADGTTYTFKLRTGVKFHNGDEMKASDVAYTFQRALLQGGTSSPQWLFAQPILGADFIDIADLVDSKLEDDAAGLQAADPAKLKDACTKVTSAITADDAANTVTFKLAQPWGPFLVTLAGPWGSVVDKAYMAQNGAWDGNCDNWAKFYGVTSDQLNQGKLGKGENGTGPFILDHWTEQQELVMKANPDYWMKEPAWKDGPSGAPKVQQVIIKFVPEFGTRFAAFQAGDADNIQPGSRSDWPQMDTITGQSCDFKTGQCTGESTTDKPLVKWVNLPTATRTDMFMTWDIDTTGGNNYIGSGKLDGNGIPPDFFNDVHVRKAMNYCFDWNTYIQSTFLGEGIQSTGVNLPGEPGYDQNAPHYTFDPAKCEEEFKASTLKSADGKSLWDTGFRFTVAYNTGNTGRQTMSQILAQAVNRVNSKFVIEITGIPWASFLKAQRAHKLPMFASGWQEDIPDASNWMVPYATQGGTYSGPQNMPKDLADQFAPLILQGTKESDPAKRGDVYKQINQLYYDNAPAILGAVGFWREYFQPWVQGFTYNQMYGYLYYYPFSKK